MNSHEDQNRPTVTQPRNAAKTFTCRMCARQFSRSEHLSRHERIHTKERPFSCSQCAKSFTRKDLLVRHRRSKHGEPRGEVGSNTNRPIERANRRVRAGARPPNDEPTNDSSTGTGELSEDVENVPLLPLQNEESFDSFENAGQLAQTSLHLHLNSDEMLLSAEPIQSIGGIPSSGDAAIGMSGEDMYSSIWDTQLFSLPWMNNFELPTAAFPSVYTAQPLWPPSIGDPTSVSPPTFVVNSEQRPDSDSIAENLGRTLPNPKPTGDQDGVQRGRTTAVSLFDRVFSRRISPEPQKLHRTSTLPRGKISREARTRLKTILNSLEHLLSDNFDLPSQHSLGRYISAYFEGFHLHLPFIHVPTWTPDSCSPGLILAVCALGAKYCFEKKTATALWSVGKIVVGVETEQIRDCVEEESPRRIEICQSLLLLMAFQTWSGDRSGLSKALSIQSTLASLVRQDGLKEPPIRGNLTWMDWVESEVRKRTKFIVYSFFNLQCLAFNVPPLILNSEVDMFLPCDEESWRAANADTWRRCGKGELCGTPSFQSALRNLLVPDLCSRGEQPAPPPSKDDSSFSILGSYVLIQGIGQHQYQLLQYSGLTSGPIGVIPLDQIAHIERALKMWQQSWEKNPEASLDPQNPYGPVAFNCIALLRLAYIRLNINFGPVCSALQSGDPRIIARAIKDHATITRDPRSTRAVLHACHALLILVKEGIELVAHTQVFVWSIQHSIASFQCCVVLVKWLEVVSSDAIEPPLSDEERWLLKLVKETLQECNVGKIQNMKDLYIMVLRVWAKIFTGTTIWNIMPIIGAALELYASGRCD